MSAHNGGGAVGEIVIKQPLVASMRVVKKETLKLISCWVTNSQDPVMVGLLCTIVCSYTCIALMTAGKRAFPATSTGCYLDGL